MPGPVDPMRLLVCELKEGALAETAGKAMAQKCFAMPML
jgi:predicted N-acetyltransferase YhbS